jgi:hypothetical protein
LNEYNDREGERKGDVRNRSDKDSDMAGQGQGQERTMTGIRQDQVWESFLLLDTFKEFSKQHIFKTKDKIPMTLSTAILSKKY